VIWEGEGARELDGERRGMRLGGIKSGRDGEGGREGGGGGTEKGGWPGTNGAKIKDRQGKAREVRGRQVGGETKKGGEREAGGGVKVGGEGGVADKW